MTSKILVLTTREDGSGRFSLTHKADGATGISRMSCDLSAADMRQLVLFCEGCDLRRTYGDPIAVELQLDGLLLTEAPAKGEIHVLRQIGYSEKAAQVEREIFCAEMAGVVETALNHAEQSKHGPLLKSMLAEMQLPTSLVQGLTDDESAQVLHRLQEMALLILSDLSLEKGGRFAKLLRGKKSRPEAEAYARDLVHSLAESLVVPKTSELGSQMGAS